MATGPTNDSTLGTHFAWISPDLPTGPTDVYYVGTHDDPAESRSLAPGDSLPKYDQGGARVKGRVSAGKTVSGKKCSRTKRKTDALLAHARQFPEQHTRQYVLDEVHLVIQAPAPLNAPETPANVLRHFGLTASTDTTFDMDSNDDASGTPATAGQASLDAGGGQVSNVI